MNSKPCIHDILSPLAAAFAPIFIAGINLASALPTPVAYWDFEETTGTVLHDGSGNSHDGSVVGTAGWAADGVSGGSLHFDGSSHVAIPASTGFSSMGTFTFSAWVWQNDTTLDRPILEFSQSGTYSGVHYWANTSGSAIVIPGAVQANLRNASTGASYPVLAPRGSVTVGKWNHVVLTFDTLTHIGKLYVNGALTGTSTLPSSQTPSTAGSFYIGYRPTSSIDARAGAHFLGRIDEVRIYKAALDSIEVLSLYSSTPSTLPAALSYASNPVVYGTGSAITPNLSIVSGTPTHFTVTPALPSGLKLDSLTGTISGTPMSASAAANYTVTASNLAGFTTAAVNIAILTAPSGLSYSVNPAVYFLGTATTPNTPSVTGTISGYSISPALPSGLTLNTTNGVVSGTPTTMTIATNYTVRVFNGPIFSTTVLNIAVLAPPSGFSYSVSSVVYGVNIPIATNSPTVSGSTPITYSVVPAFPAGLILNTSTGVISGTPGVVSALTSYVVTATNAVGSTTTSLTITVISAPANLSYSTNPAQYIIGTAIASNTPTVAGQVTSYSVNPALPTGLSLNATTGIISGTPLAPVSGMNYTVSAVNVAGSATVVLNLTARLKPSGLSYSTNPATYTAGTAIVANTPSVTGTAPLTYSSAPALPTGLALNATTGIITGTPAGAVATAAYAITATNSAGSTSANLTLTVSPSVGIKRPVGSGHFSILIPGFPALVHSLPNGEIRSGGLEILDIKGFRVAEKTFPITGGMNNFIWEDSPAGNLSEGIYLVRLTFLGLNQKRLGEVSRRVVYSP